MCSEELSVWDIWQPAEATKTARQARASLIIFFSRFLQNFKQTANSSAKYFNYSEIRWIWQRGLSSAADRIANRVSLRSQNADRFSMFTSKDTEANSGVELINAGSKFGSGTGNLNDFRSIEVKPRPSQLAYFNAVSSKNSNKKGGLQSRQIHVEDYEIRFNKLLSQSAIRKNQVSYGVDNPLTTELDR